jgi:hypothetical protein
MNVYPNLQIDSAKRLGGTQPQRLTKASHPFLRRKQQTLYPQARIKLPDLVVVLDEVVNGPREPPKIQTIH